MSEPKFKRVSIGQREDILKMVSDGLSITRVSRIMGFHKSTISRIIKRFRSSNTIKPRKRTPRKRKLSPPKFQASIKLLRREKYQTLNILRGILERKYRVAYSKSGIRHYMKREGIYARVIRKKPQINRAAQLRRVVFAKQYKNWEVSDWKKVVWTDETQFELVRAKGRHYYYTHRWDLEDRPYRETAHSGVTKIMVWGCFRNKTTGVLAKCSKKMDAIEYVNILQNQGYASLDAFQCGDDFLWMQDNAPIHNAKFTQDSMKIFGWKIMNWPPYSPDLNPIENLWAIMKQRIHRGRSFTSISELNDAIREEWDSLDGSNVLKNLIKSMPSRIHEVIRMKGKPINY